MLYMSHLWKKVQDEIVYKNINKKSINIILVPSQRYQDSRHLLKLDRVAPLMTDPPPISSTTLSKKKNEKFFFKK